MGKKVKKQIIFLHFIKKIHQQPFITLRRSTFTTRLPDQQVLRAKFIKMDITIKIGQDEQYLINASVAGEKWALKFIYEEHYGHMMAVCLRYANNEEDALDILHEGFIKVFRHISKYKAGTSISAWIRRIMVNTAIDYYRKASRRRTEDIEQAFNIKSHEQDAVGKCTVKEIMSSIQELSPAYRSVFNLYVIEGYSHKEIAKKLGITESTSRSNLVKARIKLKELLVIKGLRND